MKRRVTWLAMGLLCLGGCSDPYGDAGPLPPSPVESSPAPTGAQAADIDGQDRVAPEHEVREERAMAERPLLDRLPLRVGDVRISVAGLSADGRRAVLEVNAGSGAKQRARAAYRRALRSFGDSGVGYETRFTSDG